MRLAYKELEIDRKMEEKKLQTLEGKKREQAERLGMGFGNRRYHQPKHGLLATAVLSMFGV